MYQILSMKNPIPSCECYSIEWTPDDPEGKWTYNYRLDTPCKLTDDMDCVLLIYSHVSNLKLSKADKIATNGCNIEIHSLQEYLDYLEYQTRCDIHYRETYIKENPEVKGTENIIRVENRSYDKKELPFKYVVRPKRINKNVTDFVAV